MFSLRFLYEETVLTWYSGWQMLGFSLGHTSPGLLIIGILGVVCAHVFFIALIVIVARRRIRGRPVPRPNFVLILTLGIMTSLL